MQNSSVPRDVRLNVQKLTELPAAQPFIELILDAINDEDIIIADFSDIIRQEPALLARIMGVANSAYFSRGTPVTSVEQAIFRSLGFKLTKSLALSIALGGPFNKVRCPGFNPDEYWFVATMTAILAQHLCKHIKVQPVPEENDAYLAGMLHNIGILPMVFLYNEEMGRVFAEANHQKRLAIAEQNIIGTDHYTVGGWLTRKWHLPEIIIEVIEHHGKAVYKGPNWPLVMLIRVLSMCADHYYRTNECGDMVKSVSKVFFKLGVPVEEVVGFQKKLHHRREEVEALVKVLALD